MKLSFEIEVEQGDSIGATVSELATHISRLLFAFRCSGLRPPAHVVVPREFYDEATTTCAQPSRGPESWMDVLLSAVPEMKSIRIVPEPWGP